MFSLGAQEDHLEVERLLLETGSDKDAATIDGVNTLCGMHIGRPQEAVPLLLEARADNGAEIK